VVPVLNKIWFCDRRREKGRHLQYHNYSLHATGVVKKGDIFRTHYYLHFMRPAS
jgi:hypothetical protein